MSEAIHGSVLDQSAEITAPVRLEGQSNSEVIFNWLTVNGYLWMLESPHDTQLEQIVGFRARLHLGFKLIAWRRESGHAEGHKALAIPEDESEVQGAFARLERLIQVHFFDSGGSADV